jgi:hypothetical protein
MRSATLLILILTACAANVASGPPEFDSVQDRLEHDPARLLISAADSAGTITAERRLHDGWQTGLVDLKVDNGELVLSSSKTGTITVERFGLGFQPISLPSDVVANGQLDHVRVELAAPVAIETTWADDDTASATAKVQLSLTWSLSINGSGLPLGNPTLPAMPVELSLTGDGTVVRAELRAQAMGEVWSWADLVKLHDLSLVLSASTP